MPNPPIPIQKNRSFWSRISVFKIFSKCEPKKSQNKIPKKIPENILKKISIASNMNMEATQQDRKG